MKLIVNIMRNPNAHLKQLNVLDNEDQTFGCKHSNPDICSNNRVEGKCAFTRADEICKIPPKSWKSKYKTLLSTLP